MHPRAEILRYLDGELGAEDQARLRQHLRACAECREALDSQQRLLRALAGAPDRPTLAEDRRVLEAALRAIGTERLPPATPWVLRALNWIVEPRRLIPAAAAAAIAVLVALLLPAQWPVPAPPQPAAVVLRASKARLAGQPLAQGTEVMAGQALSVALSGMAELQLVRGGTLRVFPDTALQLAPRGEQVELERGKVWAEVDGQRGGFSVVTAHAVAEVRGTSFVVERRERLTEVRVMRGEVAVRGAGQRGGVTVRGQQRTRVAAGQAPEPAQGYRPDDDVADWERLLRELLRLIERGVRAVEKALRPEP